MSVKKLEFVKYVALSLAIGFATVFVIACVSPSPVTVVNNISNTVSVMITFDGAGVASKVPGCPAIKQIQINYQAEISIAATATKPADISATPKDANGKDREKHCDLGDGLLWSYSRQAFRFGSDTEFVTTYAGLQEGTHTISVRVGDGNGTVTVKVIK